MMYNLHCLACAQPIAAGAPTYPDVSGTLCQECAPTFAMLISDDDGCAFVDLDTEEPMSAGERRALYDAHIAAGGKPDDSMASLD
ncbi:hypothetical protein FJ422_30780 [Mesorhizobium sp. B2-6-3]|uniref:hypothetical protein n=1 Tax=Mesorhizobium sp. B2-6-3 TaxID=2589914 RepID=UPI00112CB43B|nr:hypothetical protein [Mesorhizobium sp. B2-6-3]TPJ75806.1 hypothetical protein FJ422_30780 [Mesorhizobium sp. B2-6-3]